MIIESFQIELKDRMNGSLYWDEFRSRKKCILGSFSSIKELSEVGWSIYGISLYLSSESDGCSEENAGFMFVMLMFLIMAALKVILLVVIVVVIISVCF